MEINPLISGTPIIDFTGDNAENCFSWVYVDFIKKEN